MEKIKDKVRELTGFTVEKISRMEEDTNNNVFRVTAGNKDYIFKIYRSKDWPEDGKLLFINSKLQEYQIKSVKIIAFDRNDPDFSNGFLLEEVVPGRAASQLTFDEEDEKEYYRKLAVLISQVHSIPLYNFGYIGKGKPEYSSMFSFFQHEFDNRFRALLENNIFSPEQWRKMKDLLLMGMKEYKDLPAVLCHGDLAKDNLIIAEDGTLTLIDWDDAMAYNWMADIAIMTFGMKMSYNEDYYCIMIKAFMDSYQTAYCKEAFAGFEQYFHIWIGLEWLSYYIETRDEGMKEKIREYLDKICMQDQV